MRDMEVLSIQLLRIGLILYSIGLVDSFYCVITLRSKLFKQALWAFVIGAILHLGSLVLLVVMYERLPVYTLQQMSSLTAFFITILFLAAYRRFQYESLAVFVFPLVFLLTLVGILGGPEATAQRPLQEWWIAVHATPFLLGYAGLFLTFVAGVMYLILENQLKSKRLSGLYYRLPPLGKLDEIGYQALAASFVLVTLGVIAASFWAFAKWGANWAVDPTIALAFLTWAICLIMLFSRLAIGWRGRKGAYFSIAGFCCATLTWILHSGTHSFME